MQLSTPSTELKLEKNFDEFGNSLYETTKVTDIHFIFQRVKDLVKLLYQSQILQIPRSCLTPPYT